MEPQVGNFLLNYCVLLAKTQCSRRSSCPDGIYGMDIGYGGKKVHGDRGEIQLIWGSVGSLRIIDADTIEVFDAYVVAYTGSQDKNLDGLPDSDEEPFLCTGPFADNRKRVTLMAPCETEPMP